MGSLMCCSTFYFQFHLLYQASLTGRAQPARIGHAWHNIADVVTTGTNLRCVESPVWSDRRVLQYTQVLYGT